MNSVVLHESAALTLPGEIGEAGLSLPPGLAYEEWESVGSRLQGADDSLKWWIGDWLAYGERKYGETYAAAIEKTGYGVERLRKYKWVAERVPRRVLVVSQVSGVPAHELRPDLYPAPVVETGRAAE